MGGILKLANIEEDPLMCGRTAEWLAAEDCQAHDATSASPSAIGISK
jgi:hypothetical protein